MQVRVLSRQPEKDMRDTIEIGRKLFFVEPLPEGATVTWEGEAPEGCLEVRDERDEVDRFQSSSVGRTSDC